ncbi:hypothetical protein DE146DRAFT_758770 [Phaeosphaeria sp. MPI-PUGE-AT-0046c]|nr:hypothetical protein DE146DRAFT_758770 [Phaeosphaeria sp. MPI-PUGE-AT-0046c]
MARAEDENSDIIIDENGDTFLILENPIETLKEWPSASGGSSDSEVELVSHFDKGDVANMVEQHDTPNSSGRNSRKPKPQVRYQVSSALLKNASQYFRHMLSGRFSETIVNAEDGKYHIGTQGFNPKAMEHIMNVIHIRTRNIPKKVGLEMLADIAVLVDYYDMRETVSFHAETWAKAVARKKFPATYCRELVLRTFVAKTFDDKKNFRRGAEIIIRNSIGPIEDLGVPGLDDLLEEVRQSILQVLIDRIKQIPQELEDGKCGCSIACRIMLLGTFTSVTRRWSIAGQKIDTIKRPYHGVGFESFREQVLSLIYPPIWYHRTPSHMADLDLCTLNDFIASATEASIAHARARLEELMK